MRLLIPLALLLIACSDKGSIQDTSIPNEGPADEDGDGFDVEQDCDDGDAAVYPGAGEQCDGVDQDCDGEVDEDASDASTWVQDGDGDGVGGGETLESCTQPSGAVAEGGDCDDADPSIHPGAAETDCADPTDYNCDGSVGYADADGDGYAACEECDDSARAVNPSAIEVCDGLDNDCDGEADAGAVDADTLYQDLDGDGFGDPDYSVQSCESLTGYVLSSDDCDDSDAGVNPEAEELCDGLDQDCDGDIDEDANDQTTTYADSDGDGYGDPRYPFTACEAPSGTVDNAGDCDDGEPLAWTGNTEVCDEVDNDCDGQTDEDVLTDWYLDGDGDGYGRSAGSVSACEAPTSAYVAAGGDCDDLDAETSPGAAPGCDGGDYDCDGSVDNDADGDSYADLSCGGTDCDDSDSAIYPEVGGGCALGTDCLDILNAGRSVGDGTYTIDPDGYGTGIDPVDVVCDMSTDGGGWTQIADEDYSKDSCPGSWTKDSTQPYCRRYTARGSAPSASFDSYGISYGEVMGSLTAWQYASANAFWYGTSRTVEDYYVDGISITHGASGSRSHIWTYAVGMTLNGKYAYDCPDKGGNKPPSFVGSNYTCGTGNISTTTWAYQWYSTAAINGDSFQRTLSSSTTDDVEVRLICDEEASSLTYSEDVGVSAIELWIR